MKKLKLTIAILLSVALCMGIIPWGGVITPDGGTAPASASAAADGVTVSVSGSTFTITRTDTSSAATYYYRTVDESAIAGIHYTAASGKLSFPVGTAKQTVTVSETAVANVSNVVDRYQTTDRKYRFEVYKNAGDDILAYAERTLSYGSSYNISSEYYGSEYSATVFSDQKTIDDDGYSKNGVTTVDLDSTFFSSAGAKTYFSTTGAALYTRLTFSAREKDDGYQYVQILADSTNPDYGAKDGDPGTISNSLYMAGFSIAGKGASTFYNYAFPVTNAANNCSRITDAWGSDSYYNLDNPAGDLVKQKFKADSNRSSDGTYLIIPITTSTLNYSFNASGGSSDDWYIKDVYSKLILSDTTAPTAAAVYAPTGTYYDGDYVIMSVRFSEIVTVSGTPSLTTNCGTLSYLGGSGTTALYFGGYVSSGTVSSATVSGTIKDLAGNKATSLTANLSSTFTVTTVTPSGDGSSTSPYVITDRAELYWFAEQVNGGSTSIYGKLGNDININNGSFSSSGSYTKSANGLSVREWTPIGSKSYKYTGTFDGAGYTISGLYISSDENFQGLFGYTDHATIKDLTVADSYIYTDFSRENDIGAVCGYAYYTTITNCHNANSFVKGEAAAVGGIAGDATYSPLTGCTNTGSVTGETFVGGIAGRCNTISDCLNEGTVSGTQYVGGIVGYKRSETAKSCVNLGTVSGRSDYGQIYGYNDGGTVELCFYKDSESADNSDGTFARTSTDFASGEATYLLNDGETDGNQAWYQNIDDGTADSYPVLDNTHGTVYEINHGNYTNDKDKAVHIYDANGFCTTPSNCAAYYEPAIEVNGVYEIGNAGQLYWFAAMVNGDGSKNSDIKSASPSISGMLINDIDLSVTSNTYTPIGTTSSPYKGSFNGNGFSVTMANTSSSDYQGMFGVVGGGASITGVITKGTVKGAKYTAGLVGGSSGTGTGTVTITKCGNEATVTGSGANAAGIFGCSVGSSATVTITNCYNTGAITGGSESAAISGWLGSGAAVTNCYNYGTVSGGDDSSNFARYTGTSPFKNCYSTVGTQVTSVTSDAVTSGALAYILQHNITDDTQVWGQLLSGDSSENHPVLSGNKVYKVTFKTYAADTDAYAERYANSEGTVTLPDAPTNNGSTFIAWKDTDGNVFNAETTVTGNITLTAEFVSNATGLTGLGTEESPFIITTCEQLYIFADYVNAGNTSVCGKLGADITINDGTFDESGNFTPTTSGTEVRSWTPIGSSSNSYAGTFDGAGYTISGLYINSSSDYQGLFGYIEDGTVKNVTVLGSYIKGTSRVGGIVGFSFGSCTITGCKNEGYVSGSYNVGGIVGSSYCSWNEKNIITGCENDGSVIGSGRSIGGIVGDMEGYNTKYSCYVNDCKNTGSVSGGSRVGGIAGFTRNSNVNSCINIGIVSGDSETGSIYGYNRSDTTFSSCCYLAAAAADNGDGTYAATEEQFNSGEIAYTLQSEHDDMTWGQTLSGDSADDYPVLTSKESQKVYKVTFTVVDAEYAAEYAAKYANANGTVTLPENPTKDGWQFDGWKDADGNAFNETTTVTADTTVTASFTEIPFTFDNSSSFSVQTADGDTQTGTLTFETALGLKSDVTSNYNTTPTVTEYGYAAINFDVFEKGTTTGDTTTSGVKNIQVRTNTDTEEGNDGSVFKYGEKYRWQITDIPSEAQSVGFWVVPYAKTTTSTVADWSEKTFWGSAFTYRNMDDEVELPWTGESEDDGTNGTDDGTDGNTDNGTTDDTDGNTDGTDGNTDGTTDGTTNGDSST